MALLVTGCLDAPPEYTVPAQVPPVILTSLVVPSTTETLITKSPEVDFHVPFRSDDEGEGLTAWFVVDMPTGTSDFNHVVEEILVDPSSLPFDKQGTQRAVSYPWQWSPDRFGGCHTMTMILSHTSNFGRAYDTKDPLGAAQVTWFLGLGDLGATCGSTPQQASP